MTRWLALLLLGLVVAGCSRVPTLTPLMPGAVILAFGDSLTEGIGAGGGEGYPEQLATLSGFTVVNAGVSGETTTQGLARLPGVLDDTDPALMILLMGGNDILRNENPTTTRDNLARMIDMAHSRGVEVVLLGVPEKSLFSSSAPFYAELAEHYALVFDGSMLASLLRRPGYKADAVHLNAEGYAEMASRLHELLRREGALP